MTRRRTLREKSIAHTLDVPPYEKLPRNSRGHHSPDCAHSSE
jgi:hypothetical protein